MQNGTNHNNVIYLCGMKIWDTILQRWLGRESRNTLYDISLNAYGGFCVEERMQFARVIFYNICNLLTDIANEVVFTRVAGDKDLFAGFNAFFNTWGQYVLNKLFVDGYCVIGIRGSFMWIMQPTEYTQLTAEGKIKIIPRADDVNVYVMKSQTWVMKQQSDEQLLQAWLRYLDNVLNSSNTISSRLGSMVIMSPQNAPSAPTVAALTKEQRDELENNLSNDYGSLDRQKQVMLLTRPVNTQVVNLAGLDQKTSDKVRLAILAICDRIKVPANQVAIIDANSSKSLSNGTELREGDLTKYRSFRRLLNATFWQMAENLGLQVDYNIENEPKTTQGQEIEQ